MSQLSVIDVVIRLCIAMLAGGLIGSERRYFGHCPAGIRTHMLVAIGACCVMMTSHNYFAMYSVFGSYPDPARLPAQIIVGIGFLGTGCLLHEGGTVSGLSTAASVWVIACMGIVAGTDYYLLSLTSTIVIFLMLLLIDVHRLRLHRQRINEILNANLKDSEKEAASV